VPSPRLLTHVGGRPVGPGYTCLPGADAGAVPEGLAAVRRAGDLARAVRLQAEARRGGEDLQAVDALDRQARRARARAMQPGEDAVRWNAEADALEAARDAQGFDELAFVALGAAAFRAHQDLEAIAGRPLIVLGDDPDLGDALDHAMDHHPQVVHLPDA